MKAGFRLFRVLKISNPSVLGRFTSIVDLPDLSRGVCNLSRVSNSFSTENYANEIVLPSAKLCSSDTLTPENKSFKENWT